MTSKILSKQILHIASAAWQPHVIQSKQALSRALDCRCYLVAIKASTSQHVIARDEAISKLYKANMPIAKRSIAAKAVTLS